MKENFDKCLKMLLAHEGGYVNHPSDPGGMTNLGVTKKVYDEWTGRESTEQEMRDLTPATLGLIMEKDPKFIIEYVHDVRQDFYKSLKTFETFGRGWTRRNKETLHQALEML